jgi:hypothetical protein
MIQILQMVWSHNNVLDQSKFVNNIELQQYFGSKKTCGWHCVVTSKNFFRSKQIVNDIES